MSKKISNAEMIDDANPDWTEAVFEIAMQIDGLPMSLQDKLHDGHGPQKLPRKVETDLQPDTEFIKENKSDGSS
jgi:hypothetical protein